MRNFTVEMTKLRNKKFALPAAPAPGPAPGIGGGATMRLRPDQTARPCAERLRLRHFKARIYW